MAQANIEKAAQDWEAYAAVKVSFATYRPGVWGPLPYVEHWRELRAQAALFEAALDALVAR